MTKSIYTFIAVLFIAIAMTSCKEEKVYSVSLDKEKLTMSVGEQYQLTLTVLPQSSKARKITWNSTDNSVASINSEGLVTAESIGTATITAETGGVTAKCEVTVVKKGDYKMKVTMTKEGECDVTKLLVLMAAPLTNEYQTITNLKSSAGDYIESCCGNQILYNKFLDFTDGMEVYQTFDFERKKISMDFSKAPSQKNDCGTSKPSDFLGDDLPYVDLSNSTIQAIGDSIWALSDDNIDYARRCYEYTATALEYSKDGGIKTLEELLKDMKGKSPDFSTFYVNLMRYKQIPARHIFTTNPKNGSYYVFTDFYDEDYGWIPVDATSKCCTPENDYFGQYKFGLIIESFGLTTFSKDDLVLESEPLIHYYYWYWGSGSGSINLKYSFEGK